jgi:hypothetical protein
VTEPYTGPERRQTPTKIAELEDATRRLTSEVGGLRSAIETVNDIQRRQLEVEEAARESRELMEQGLLPKVARLDDQLVPRDEYRYREREYLLITGGAVLLAIHVHEVARDFCGHGGSDAVQPHHGHVVHAACDMAFPESTGHQHFPSPGNDVGFVVYAAVLAIGIRRFLTARRRRREIEQQEER